MLVRARTAVVVVLALVASVLGVGLLQTGTAKASTTVQDKVVSPTPVSWTPRVNDGEVDSIVQIGSTLVIGGNFTSVSSSSGSPTYTRRYIATMDAASGAISTAFAPVLNGNVNKLLPGPVAGTVLVGGAFSTVNGTPRRGVALLNVSNGSLVASFNPASMNGNVNDMKVMDNRLYIGGTFTTVGGQAHARLASLNATTGALDPFVDNQFSVNHNWYSGCTDCAQGGVQVKNLDVSADGSTLIAIGNFKQVDGYTRDQIVNIDLSGSSAQVRPDWNSNAYTARCFYWAFDTYMRGLAMSPDGSYFVVATTGGANGGRAGGTHCDTASRFATTDRGQDVQPTWSEYAGGDTFTAVEVAGTAVYTGGHMRWLNNDFGSDSAGPGAVGRAGLAALDPLTGTPLSWNPGRNPRGYGVTALYATSAGLWLGSDTDYIGNRRYLRPKLAFFPLSGGSAVPAGQPMSLPSNVYLGGPLGGGGTSSVLYRLDTGGSDIGAVDAGPDWVGDASSAGLRSGASSAASYSGGVAVDSSVPASTPNAIFDSERWGSDSTSELAYHLPVPAGQQVTVRLYFANRYSGTSTVGSRVFDVSIDGQPVLNDFDIVAAAGDQTGTMKAFPVTSDGTVDIEFGHVTENPLVDGIEVVTAGPPPAPAAGTLSRRWFDGTTASTDTPVTGSGIDWSTVRGAVQIDGSLFYGDTDGYLHQASYDGSAFGTPKTLDPYHDPAWCSVRTGSGDSVFCGVAPNLTWSSVTAMAFAGGRLYYTLLGQTGLYYRTFSPDSGIVGATQFQVSANLPAGAPALLLSGGSLYFADRTSGNLSKIAFSAAGTSGSATTVSGPGIDGRDWRARAVFMAPGPDGPQPPKDPIASFTASCTQLLCSVDGSGSSDPDGTIASYAWDFGDGSPLVATTTPTSSHTYVTPGTYTIRLTVTDDSGATGSAQQSVNPSLPAPVAAFTSVCDVLVCNFDGSGSSTGAPGALTYAWAFGDTSTGSGKTAQHEYQGPGTYSVTLTVTDSLGRKAQVGHDVSASDSGQVQPIAFVSSTGSNANVTSASATVPAATQAGDGLLAVLSLNTDATVTTPAGWTLEGTGTNSGLFSRVYRRTAAAADAGATVQFTFSKRAKAALDVAVYRNVADGDFVTATSASYGSGTARQAPATTITTTGSWVVSWWTDKGPGTTTSWTAPGVTVRRSSFGTGGGSISSLLADSGQPAAAGTYPARTATSNASGNKADAWSIVLAPATSGPPAPAPPTAAFTSTCSQLTCSFDGTASSTGAAGALSYAWAFGDGATGTGATPSHTYGTGGNYDVTLTVTDTLSRTAHIQQTARASSGTPDGDITFVGATGANGNVSAAKVTVPASVQPGDGLVLALSMNSTQVVPTTPAGWALVDQAGTNGMMTRVYSRTATAGDAGSTVTIAYSGGYAKTAVDLAAYRGVAAGRFVSTTSVTYNATGAARQSPAAPDAASDSWALSWWTDKSAATTTSWVLPGTVTQRRTSYGTGGGAISSALADSAGPVGTGGYAARTATSNAPSGNAVAWTLVIAAS